MIYTFIWAELDTNPRSTLLHPGYPPYPRLTPPVDMGSPCTARKYSTGMEIIPTTWLRSPKSPNGCPCHVMRSTGYIPRLVESNSPNDCIAWWMKRICNVLTIGVYHWLFTNSMSWKIDGFLKLSPNIVHIFMIYLSCRIIYYTVRNTLREIELQNDYCNGCGLTDHGCGMTLLWFFYLFFTLWHRKCQFLR